MQEVKEGIKENPNPKKEENNNSQKPDFVKWFSELNKNSVDTAGGKGANLAEIYNLKIPVPPGFVVTAQAYDYFIEKAGIKETGIVTNGTLLDEKTAEKLIISEILDTVIFSIDGREENHDFLRGGKGVFEKAVNGLNILSQIKRKLKRRRPRIYVYMTLYRENIKDMEYVFNIALKSNANMLRYQTSSHITKRIITRLPDRFQAGFFHSYAGREKPLSRVEIEEIRENYLKILERSKKHAIKTEAEEIIKSGVNKKCLFVGKDFVIDSSGEILPCPMLPNVSIGSLIEKSVEEIFSGQKNFILELKKISESGKLSVCGQCCVEKQSKHVAEDKGQPLF